MCFFCACVSQTASWISAAPSVLEEYMQCVSNGEDLKFLLQSKQCHGKLAKSSIGMHILVSASSFSSRGGTILIFVSCFFSCSSISVR